MKNISFLLMINLFTSLAWSTEQSDVRGFDLKQIEDIQQFQIVGNVAKKMFDSIKTSRDAYNYTIKEYKGIYCTQNNRMISTANQNGRSLDENADLIWNCDIRIHDEAVQYERLEEN